MEGDTKHRPAGVVEQFHNTGEDAKLWAFGFDMDNMKARCWYDATMPIMTISQEQEILFNDSVTRMVKGADKVEDYLGKNLKMALFPEKSKIKIKNLHFAGDFWELTETAFYKQLRKLRDTLPTDPVAQMTTLRSWLKTLRKEALSVFDRYSGDLTVANPRRVARARNKLNKALTGAQLQEKILGLPKLPKLSRKRS